MKRQTIRGWIVRRKGNAFMSDDPDHSHIYVFPTRAAALDNSTAGEHDVTWQRGLLKNGHEVIRIRLTATVE